MEQHSLKSFNVFYASKSAYILLKMNFHAFYVLLNLFYIYIANILQAL